MDVAGNRTRPFAICYLGIGGPSTTAILIPRHNFFAYITHMQAAAAALFASTLGLKRKNWPPLVRKRGTYFARHRGCNFTKKM
jgi:hypothetical protein